MNAYAQRNLPHPDKPAARRMPPTGQTNPGIVAASSLTAVSLATCRAQDCHAPARRYTDLAPHLIPSWQPSAWLAVRDWLEEALIAASQPAATSQQLPLQPGQAPPIRPATPVMPGFPVKLGQHTINKAGITVHHSAMDQCLRVTYWMAGLAGKQTQNYPVSAARQGEQVLLDSRSATRSLIPLAEWQAFADTLEVKVSSVSVNTIPMSEPLIRMARDVIAYRRQSPTDAEWAAETRPQDAATSQQLPETAEQKPALAATYVQVKKMGVLVGMTFVRWGDDFLVYRDGDTEFNVSGSVLLDRIARGYVIVTGEMPEWAKVAPEESPKPKQAPAPKPERTQLKVKTARGLLDGEFVAWTDTGLRYNDGKWPCFVPADQLRRKLRLGEISITGYRPDWANVPVEAWSEDSPPTEQKPADPEPTSRTRVTMRVGQRQVELTFVEWTDDALVILNNLGRRQMLKRDRLIGDLITGKYAVHGDKPEWAQTPWEHRKSGDSPAPRQNGRHWGYDYGLVVKRELHPWKWIRRKCVCAHCRNPLRAEPGSEQVDGEPGAWYFECSGPDRHAIKTERDLVWAHTFVPLNPGADGKSYDADPVLEAYDWLKPAPDPDIPF